MQQQRPNRKRKHASMFLLTVLAFLVGTSDALRKDLYKVGSDDINRSSSLRGNLFARQRVSSQKLETPGTTSERALSLDPKEELSDLLDPLVIRMVEDRRSNAMEALFEAEKFMFALRFSMSMDMSMDMSMAPVRCGGKYNLTTLFSSPSHKLVTPFALDPFASAGGTDK
jgi:hypothetical protein